MEEESQLEDPPRDCGIKRSISSPNLFVAEPLHPVSVYGMDAITLVEIPPLQVLGMRQRGNYRIIPELLQQIFEFAMRNRVAIAGMPMFLMHERSKEEAMEADRTGTADVEVVVPVSGSVRAEGKVRAYSIPGGKMARIMHKGPYENSEQSYAKLMTWIAEKGLQVKGPIREIYHNNPQEVKPEEILTEILVPIG
jgi:effector-binding domain-containing protein